MKNWNLKIILNYGEKQFNYLQPKDEKPNFMIDSVLWKKLSKIGKMQQKILKRKGRRTSGSRLQSLMKQGS